MAHNETNGTYSSSSLGKSRLNGRTINISPLDRLSFGLSDRFPQRYNHSVNHLNALSNVNESDADGEVPQTLRVYIPESDSTCPIDQKINAHTDFEALMKECKDHIIVAPFNSDKFAQRGNTNQNATSGKSNLNFVSNKLRLFYVEDVHICNKKYYEIDDNVEVKVKESTKSGTSTGGGIILSKKQADAIRRKLVAYGYIEEKHDDATKLLYTFLPNETKGTVVDYDSSKQNVTINFEHSKYEDVSFLLEFEKSVALEQLAFSRPNKIYLRGYGATISKDQIIEPQSLGEFCSMNGKNRNMFVQESGSPNQEIQPWRILCLGKDFLLRFAAAKNIEKDNLHFINKTLLKSVINPKVHQESSFVMSNQKKTVTITLNSATNSKKATAAAAAPVFPINPSQEIAVKAVLGLTTSTTISDRITPIQGPPGTGKSTTIYHVCDRLLNEIDPTSKVIVTCVTNQAINSVCEKLGEAEKKRKNQNLILPSLTNGNGNKDANCDYKGSQFEKSLNNIKPSVNILVLGHKDKVGDFSKEFLLNEKVKRDTLAQDLGNALSHFQLKWADGVLRKWVEAEIGKSKKKNISRLFKNTNESDSEEPPLSREQIIEEAIKRKWSDTNEYEQLIEDIYKPAIQKFLLERQILRAQYQCSYSCHESKGASSESLETNNPAKEITSLLDISGYLTTSQSDQFKANKTAFDSDSDSESATVEPNNYNRRNCTNSNSNTIVDNFINLKFKIDSDLDLLNFIMSSNSTGTTVSQPSILRSCLLILNAIHEWSLHTITRRVVAKVNVFLFTVASSERLIRFKSEYKGYVTNSNLRLAILDEAGATPESHIPVILSLGVENLMLLGDTEQLRPMVKSGNHRDSERVLEEKQVNRSLMERCIDCKSRSLMNGNANGIGASWKSNSLSNNNNTSDIMLTEQYRMPPKLCMLVSELFYNNRLQTGEGKIKKYQEYVNKLNKLLSPTPSPDSELRIVAGNTKFTNSCQSSLIWLDHPNIEEGKIGHGFCTPEHSVTAAMWLHHHKETLIQRKESVLIISMYKNQARHLQQLVNSDVGLQLSAKQSLNSTGPLKDSSSNTSYLDLRIVTVDAAQGAEADNVLLLLSRCNSDGKIGFCTNKNRVNVAISRAKQQLIIIGCSKTMSGSNTNGTGEPSKGNTTISIWNKIQKACDMQKWSEKVHVGTDMESQVAFMRMESKSESVFKKMGGI